MKIKVCGMREPENIADVARLKPDFMGFIFYPPSPRHALPALDASMIASLPEGITPVAVTVNMKEEDLLVLAEEHGFRAFQLHGNEDPGLCRSLRDKGFIVIKAFGVRNEEDFQDLDRYSGCVDYFLFDTATESKGGSGRKFDWDLLSRYNLPEPFLLSGGISSGDAEEISRIIHPRFSGIDLNSRFEIAPALKDASLLNRFITQIKNL